MSSDAKSINNLDLEKQTVYGTIGASEHNGSSSLKPQSRCSTWKVALAIAGVFATVNLGRSMYGDNRTPRESVTVPPADEVPPNTGQCSVEYPDCSSNPVVRIQCNLDTHPDCMVSPGKPDFYLDWLSANRSTSLLYCESIGEDKCIKRSCEISQSDQPSVESILSFPALNHTDGIVEPLHPANGESNGTLGSARMTCTASGPVEKVEDQESMYLMGPDLWKRLGTRYGELGNHSTQIEGESEEGLNRDPTEMGDKGSDLRTSDVRPQT